MITLGWVFPTPQYRDDVIRAERIAPNEFGIIDISPATPANALAFVFFVARHAMHGAKPHAVIIPR